MPPSSRPGGERRQMKALETIMAALSWVVLAIVLWALAPLLIKLIDMANGINHLFNK